MADIDWLQDILDQNPAVTWDLFVLLVDGVALFSLESDPDQVNRAFNLLTAEQAAAAIELQKRIIRARERSFERQFGPPPEGMIYHFDFETQEVEEIPDIDF